jgi:alpha-tubulin suppressor-like RCC1 family protein
MRKQGTGFAVSAAGFAALAVSAACNAGYKPVLQVEAGDKFTCAIVSVAGGVRTDVYCWGANYYGQLGIGPGLGQYKATPEMVKLPATDIQSISVGHAHACAISRARGTYCWGWNGDQQVANSPDPFIYVPQRVATPSNIAFLDVEAGFDSTCAIGTDSKAYCWGSNGAGQLGTGDYLNRSIPTQVIDVAGASRLALGAGHTCAIEGARVKCWGSNSAGQLGTSAAFPQSNPFPTVVFSDTGPVRDIATGHAHTCVVSSSGLVHCAGSNVEYQLSVQPSSPSNPYFQPAMGPFGPIGDIFDVSAGHRTTCANSISGFLCWGNNFLGQLGLAEGASGPRVATQYATIDFVKKASNGTSHTCAITFDNRLWCWGDNSWGQIGNGAVSSQPMRPTLVYFWEDV